MPTVAPAFARPELEVRRVVALLLSGLFAPVLVQFACWLGRPESVPNTGHEALFLLLSALALLPLVVELVGASLAAWRPLHSKLARAVEAGVATALLLPLGASLLSALSLVLSNVALYAFATPALAGRLPEWMEDLARLPKARRAALCVVSVLALVQCARLTTYMAVPAAQAASIYYVPGMASPKVKRPVYSTVTTYVSAAIHNREHPERNVYDSSLYPASSKDTLKVSSEMLKAGLGADGGFIYPPSFLLIPRALLLLTSDPLCLRFAWFVLEGALLFAGYAFALGVLSGPARLHALASAPLVAGSFTALVALQVGNYHVAVLILALLAALAIERGRERSGALLLALALLTKVYPAVLVTTLAVKRRYAALAWLALSCLGLVAVTIMVCGARPFVDFASYVAPRMSSREAFPFLRDPTLIPSNFSAEALLLKVRLIGVHELSDGLIRKIGLGLSVLLAAAAVIGLARAERDAHSRLLATLAALNLVVLTTPWAPGYVELGFLLLLPLLPPQRRPEVPKWVWLGLCVLLFCPDLPFLPARARSVYTSLAQCAGVALDVWVLLWGARRARELTQTSVYPNAPSGALPLQRHWEPLVERRPRRPAEGD
jgi:alpha-1,2-mannosyltransferase